MLFLYITYYLVLTSASPISLGVLERSLVDSVCSSNRTIWDIIWSCLTTIFACIWVAVHPNIPYPIKKKKQDKGWVARWIWRPLVQFYSSRLLLLLCAVLVPEYVLAWAIRQRIRAGVIAAQHKDQRWTIAHGFLVVMGGFHLFRREHPGRVSNLDSEDNDTPLHPLTMLDLDKDQLLDTPTFDFIMPTREEIRHKGKGDWIAKALVLLQTTWFVLQCIARATQNLPLTELELVTLAYTIMSFAMYMFWWHKPLNVGRPVRVYRRDVVGQPEVAVKPELPKEHILGPSNRVQTILYFVAGQQDVFHKPTSKGTPTFWSDITRHKDVAKAATTVLAIGIVFGAIHCIAWSFIFPSHAERFLWRISSIIITTAPVVLLVVGITYFHAPIGRVGTALAFTGMVLTTLLYILARMVTLVLALMALRSLMPDVYRTVQWTTYIPHI